MIHGIVGTPAHFKAFIPLVSDTASVYNLLLDGHGGSVRDFAKTSMAKWEAQINSRLEEIFLRHEKVFILAHSMGTLFAIDAAIKHPERVEGLFLLSVPLAPRVTFKAAFAAIQIALGINKKSNVLADAMIEDTSVRLEKNPFKYIGWIPRYLELFGLVAKTKRQLKALRTPGICFQARRDELVRERAERIIGENTALDCRVLENSGHFAYSEGDMKILKDAFSERIHKFEEDTDVQRNCKSQTEA